MNSKYYFNYYDDRHYGWQLGQIDEEAFDKFKEGEDEDYLDFNPVILELNYSDIYWLEICDYSYWIPESGYTLHKQKPKDYVGNIFRLEFNKKDDGWDSSCD
jgi:hypothetical protein